MGKIRRSREFRNNSQVIDMEQARAKRLERRRAERRKEKKRAEEAARQKSRSRMAIRRKHNLLWFAAVIFMLGIISFFISRVIVIIDLEKEKHDVKEQKQELLQQKEELSEQIEDSNDLENLNDQARDQLRLIRRGEKIYIFPEEITEQEEETDGTDGAED